LFRARGKATDAPFEFAGEVIGAAGYLDRRPAPCYPGISSTMDRLLARLERRFGRYAIENLTNYIVGGMAIVFLLTMSRQAFVAALTLSPHAIARGEVWRLVTYLFIPTSGSTYWILFSLYWVWWIGATLEAQWGAFKLNAYYLVGMLGTTAAALIVQGDQGNWYLNLSLLFAFATLFPEYEILVFFVLPVKMKWLAWLSFAYEALTFARGDWDVRAAIVASLVNYLLFFWGDIVALAKGTRLQARQAAVRESRRAPPEAPSARVCALCGAREADGADIRVCSCEKCKAATGGAARELCLEHARNH
jgi:hypothetical protein